jgi:hypothetical protein
MVRRRFHTVTPVLRARELDVGGGQGLRRDSARSATIGIPMEAGLLSPDEVTNDERVSTLRGAGVSVDKRRLVWWVLLVIAVGLLVASVTLAVAGSRKNDQTSQLRQHGVAVVVTTTGCQGLLGGSGSNVAGYVCRGSFALDGRRYTETLPGSTFLAPGTKVNAIVVPSDPGLIRTPAILAGEHASNSVYILPVVLGVLGIGAVITLVRLRRKSAPGADPANAS